MVVLKDEEMSELKRGDASTFLFQNCSGKSSILFALTWVQNHGIDWCNMRMSCVMYFCVGNVIRLPCGTTVKENVKRGYIFFPSARLSQSGPL